MQGGTTKERNESIEGWGTLYILKTTYMFIMKTKKCLNQSKKRSIENIWKKKYIEKICRKY